MIKNTVKNSKELQKADTMNTVWMEHYLVTRIEGSGEQCYASWVTLLLVGCELVSEEN